MFAIKSALHGPGQGGTMKKKERREGMSILAFILGFILMMTGIGAMAFFALTFFFPILATLLWFRWARLPRIYAVVGLVTGMEMFFLGMMLIDIGISGTAHTVFLSFAGFIPMFTGMVAALAFFIGFLCPPFLRVLQVRADRQPRLRAFAGILAGYVLMGVGGFVWDVLDGGKGITIPILGITSFLMSWGTIGCFFLAFLYPPLLDKLWIKRGVNPRVQALEFMLAGVALFLLTGFIFFELLR